MKKRILITISVMVMLFIISSQTTIFAKNESGMKSSDAIPDSEYSAINKELNSDAKEGKFAGETDMEDAFASNYSGGLSQQIGDTVEAQNEMQRGVDD